ncbi:hypothetical protein [Devosia sp. DBB001]|nr:hypothetical protein [Devosia sp. DBB001]
MQKRATADAGGRRHRISRSAHLSLPAALPGRIVQAFGNCTRSSSARGR